MSVYKLQYKNMKVLKFGAVWCNTCLVMKPRWEEIEQEHDWLETEYYDADEREDLIEEHEVETIPSFIFLNQEGEEIERLKGEVSKEKLVETIKELKDK